MKKKEKKWPPVDPKIDPKKVKSGSGAVLTRNKKGDIVATKKKDFAGVSTETLRADAKVRAKTGNRNFTGAPSPRGGKQKTIAPSGNLKSATKKVIRQSRKKPTGSPQAKASQKRNRF